VTLALVLDGAAASLVKVDGERFAMTAVRAYAPGAPLKATIEGTMDAVEMKVGRSIRRAEGEFEVEGRLVNVTRALRQLLDAHCAGPTLT